MTRRNPGVSSYTYYLIFIVAYVFGLPLMRRVTGLARGPSGEGLRRRRAADAPKSGDRDNHALDSESSPGGRYAWILTQLDILFSVLGGLTLTRWLGVPGPDDWGGAGPAGIVFMFLAAIALFVASGFTCYLIYKLRKWKGALAAYGSVVALFVFGFLMPVGEQQAANAKAREERARVIAQFESRMDRARAKWVADVRAAGAWGAPGTEPPMLKVIDEGASVTITNVIDIDIPCVNLARIYHDSSPGDGYFRCEMKRERDNVACRTLPPGGSHTYALRSGAENECRNGKLEYRIGKYTDPEPTWWTSTALKRFERSSEEIERRSSRRRAIVSGSTEDP